MTKSLLFALRSSVLSKWMYDSARLRHLNDSHGIHAYIGPGLLNDSTALVIIRSESLLEVKTIFLRALRRFFLEHSSQANFLADTNIPDLIESEVGSVIYVPLFMQV